MSVPVAVVVLNHNGGDGIETCLQTVIEQGATEVVVVDNASTDGSVERLSSAFPSVHLERNATNRGFSAAANQGARLTSAPVILFLNQDATLHPGALEALVAAFTQRPRAGVVGAEVRNPDGTIQPTRRRFPSLRDAVWHGIVGIFRPDNPGTRAYTLRDAELDSLQTIDWVAGTAMAIRREAFDALDGFDEAYFFFVEDVDLCKRAWAEGWEVCFQPAAVVTHEWGGGWRSKPLRFLWLHQWNLFRYVRTHYRGAWVLVYPLIGAGLLVRFALLALRWLITRRSVPEHRSIGERR